MRRPRMPRSIRLPFGYSIPIRYRTRRQMAAIGLPGADASWVSDDRAMYVCRDLPAGEQCESIAHEMGHVAIDYREWVDGHIRAPLQVECATAELALAEDEE